MEEIRFLSLLVVLQRGVIIARYGVSFVNIISDAYFTSVIAVPYVKSSYDGSRYNGTPLYLIVTWPFYPKIFTKDTSQLTCDYVGVSLWVPGLTYGLPLSPLCCIRQHVILDCVNSLRPSDTYMHEISIIGSDNGLSPDRHQAIIWTNADLLFLGSKGTNSMKFEWKFETFHSRKCVWKCHLRNGGQFVSASMS